MGRCGDSVATRGSAPPPPEGHARSPGTDRRNRSRRAMPGAPRCCPPSHTAPDRSRSFPPAGPFVQAGPRPPATPHQASALQRPRADAGGEEGGAAALSGPPGPAPFTHRAGSAAANRRSPGYRGGGWRRNGAPHRCACVRTFRRTCVLGALTSVRRTEHAR